MNSYTDNYLENCSQKDLEIISKLWEDGKDINYQTTTKENLIKFIKDSLN